jgi:hypothetical protein
MHTCSRTNAGPVEPGGGRAHRPDGDMRKRWTAAGMLVAEQQFRRIIGYRDLAKLVIAVERHAAKTAPRAPTTVTHTQVSEVVTV